ncbi:olfactory receptor 10A7-like [Pelodytes ibericus]
METVNQSRVTEFILLGLSTDPRVRLPLFPPFLVAYLALLLRNSLLIVAVFCDRRLHNPMYFFLVNLSFINLCGPSVTIPKMLVDLLSQKSTISLDSCRAQIFFLFLFHESECFLLVFMAYDRFVAICNPMRYTAVMNRATCTWMVSAIWIASFIITSIGIVLTYQLTFCGPNILNHYFCQATSLLTLSCEDIAKLDILRYAGSIVFLLVPLLLILFSYYKIVVSIMRIQSGRCKAFSICLSHLIVVTLFYLFAMFIYLRPRHMLADNTDKIVSVFYTVIIPTVNPSIYSLRNKDVHSAVRRLWRLT